MSHTPPVALVQYAKRRGGLSCHVLCGGVASEPNLPSGSELAPTKGSSITGMGFAFCPVEWSHP